ncbi:MAG: M28 family peptidase, partial [Bacteroidales bacterium]|nr:M28 family peptidase [Bacteroidales bacterium]
FKDGGNFNSKGIIFLKEDKVWWHVSNGKEVLDYFKLQIISDKIPISSKTITIKVNNTYFTDYQTQNVIGFVEGKVEPDSFLVFTAHYDHLGQMGADTYFPGANDNASGTAMLLNLARHYSLSENRPDYSIVFMALSAEEVGLMGSEFYATNPLFPLERIKFLVNLDMVGSGSQGVKVVNGSIFKDKFNLLVKLNTKHEYIRKVEERGEAANSDHYPFYAQGVPCFFIYTLGDECKEYHNIYDVSDNVPLTEYDDFFKLLLDFINTF